jgi:hypothetical protein
VSGLADTLRRFHALVVGAAPLSTASELVEGGAVPAAERLGVYARAYPARIADVLAADYPKLAALGGLGRELTEAYLRAHPPAHPSLREAGAHVARFLAARGAPAHDVELARLERARTEAFDGGADVVPLARDHLAARPAAAFPRLRLRLVPSAQAIALTTNADERWAAVEEDRPLPPPAAAARTVLVWRRDVTVVHRALDPDEARLAPALAAGTTFADVCEGLAGDPAPAERASALLLRWVDAGALDGIAGA